MTDPSKVVFLSYCHADEAAAVEIYKHLQAMGLRPWLDKFSLGPGTVWKVEIDRAVRTCGAFLSLVSHSSVDRGGILAGEMKLALDLRGQRLDSGGLLIPVLLEPTDLPAELQHLQALAWFAEDGPAKLSAALAPLQKAPSLSSRLSRIARGPWALAATAIAFAAIGIIAYKMVSAASGSAAYERFMHSRITPQPSNAAPQIGITVWRVTEDNASGSGVCGFLRFARKPLADPVHTGERLRLDVQASHPGYIYVISREVDDSGKTGAAELLYPVTSVNNGANAIAPGNALLIPPTSDVCGTLQLTHAGAEERVSVIFSATPIDVLRPHDTPYTLDASVYSAVLASVADCTRAGSQDPPSSRGIELPDNESRHLDYAAAGPDAVFTAAKPSTAAMATFSLQTSK